MPSADRMDYGKYLYQEQKREHQAHKHAHASEMKEVKLKTRIGKHDLEIKVNHAKEFLAMGHRVKFTLVFKGREITHLDIGETILKEVVQLLADSGKVERPPYREGRAMGLIVAPKTSAGDKPKAAEKPKPKEQPAAKPQ
ncbi:MAG: translation initiation factor IF-3 [Planctomycetota bacterium]|nr:translation initiation factor IF-3 [Planctomycetota bacterium]